MNGVGIVDLDEAKARLGIDPSDTDVDDELSDFIEALDAPVENYLHETITVKTVEEDLDLCGRSRFWLTNSPVISLTSLTSLDGATTYDVTRLKARPSGLVRVITGPRPTGTATVIYEAGYETVPANIREGALVILQHVWETQRGPGGVGAGVIGPEEIRRTLSTYTVPAKAREWLGEPTSLAR